MIHQSKHQFIIQVDFDFFINKHGSSLPPRFEMDLEADLHDFFNLDFPDYVNEKLDLADLIPEVIENYDNPELPIENYVCPSWILFKVDVPYTKVHTGKEYINKEQEKITPKNFKKQNQETQLEMYHRMVMNFDPEDLIHNLAEPDLYIEILKFKSERHESLNDRQHSRINYLLRELNTKKREG